MCLTNIFKLVTYLQHSILFALLHECKHRLFFLWKEIQAFKKVDEGYLSRLIEHDVALVQEFISQFSDHILIGLLWHLIHFLRRVIDLALRRHVRLDGLPLKLNVDAWALFSDADVVHLLSSSLDFVPFNDFLMQVLGIVDLTVVIFYH